MNANRVSSLNLINCSPELHGTDQRRLLWFPTSLIECLAGAFLRVLRAVTHSGYGFKARSPDRRSALKEEACRARSAPSGRAIPVTPATRCPESETPGRAAPPS